MAPTSPKRHCPPPPPQTPLYLQKFLALCPRSPLRAPGQIGGRPSRLVLVPVLSCRHQ